MKDLLIALLLAVIVALKLVDVMADMALDLPVAHLAQEWVLLTLSAAGCIYLIRDIRRRTRDTQQLRSTLNFSDARLQQLGEQVRRARRAFALTIRDQFEAWQLTQSEQEVAMLILKGLSLQEIAALRSTREKTVRQHASNIYSKAGVEGRHALSAWFLEDLFAEARPDGPSDRESAA